MVESFNAGEYDGETTGQATHLNRFEKLFDCHQNDAIRMGSGLVPPAAGAVPSTVSG